MGNGGCHERRSHARALWSTLHLASTVLCRLRHSCCAGHLLLETKGCTAVGRGCRVMSSDSVEAWDAQEWVVIELQVRPWRPFHPHPLNNMDPPVEWGGFLWKD